MKTSHSKNCQGTTAHPFYAEVITSMSFVWVIMDRCLTNILEPPKPLLKCCAITLDQFWDSTSNTAGVWRDPERKTKQRRMEASCLQRVKYFKLLMRSNKQKSTKSQHKNG